MKRKGYAERQRREHRGAEWGVGSGEGEGAVPVLLALDSQLTPATKDGLKNF